MSGIMDQPTALPTPPSVAPAQLLLGPAANAPWYLSSRFWLTTAFKIFCALTASGAIPGTPESVKIVAFVSALFALLGYTASRTMGDAAAKVVAPVVAILLLWGQVASADVIVPKRIGHATIGDALLQTGALFLLLAGLAALFLWAVYLIARGMVLDRQKREQQALRSIKPLVVLLAAFTVGGIACADGGSQHPPAAVVDATASLPNAMAAANGGSGNMVPPPAPPATTPPPDLPPALPSVVLTVGPQTTTLCGSIPSAWLSDKEKRGLAIGGAVLGMVTSTVAGGMFAWAQFKQATGMP